MKVLIVNVLFRLLPFGVGALAYLLDIPFWWAFGLFALIALEFSIYKIHVKAATLAQQSNMAEKLVRSEINRRRKSAK